MGHQAICGFGAPQSHDDGERDGESGGERDLPEITWPRATLLTAQDDQASTSQ